MGFGGGFYGGFLWNIPGLGYKYQDMLVYLEECIGMCCHKLIS